LRLVVADAYLKFDFVQHGCKSGIRFSSLFDRLVVADTYSKVKSLYSTSWMLRAGPVVLIYMIIPSVGGSIYQTK